MSEQPQHANLAAALVAVMADMPTVPKNGRNNFQNYDYSTESDIYNALRPLLVRHGIAILTDHRETTAETIEKTKGGNETRYVVTVDYHVLHVSGEKMTVQAVGTGQSKDEKGLYAALTGAAKYFFAKTFMISTDDDPELDRGRQNGQANERQSHRPPQPQRTQGRQQTPRKGSQPKPEVPKEAKEIFNLARAAVGDEEAAKWCKALAGKRGVTSLARVPGSLLAGKLQELEAMSLEERSDYILNAIHAGSSTEHAPSPTTQPTARKSGVTDGAPTDGRGAKDGATLPHERDIPGIGGRR